MLPFFVPVCESGVFFRLLKENRIVFVNLHNYMSMKRIITAFFAAGLLFLAGCGQDDDVLPSQKTGIVGFLTGSHDPKLISEDQVPESIDVNPPYYSVFGNAVYRYIKNVYAEGRDRMPEVVRGSSVTITYQAYLFQNKAIDAKTMPYDSNDPAIEEVLYEAGLTPGAWVFEPLTVKIGASRIIKGLEHALIGCREGDEVEAYMTYNMAYGDKNFSIIPLNSPVAWLFTVDKVE